MPPSLSPSPVTPGKICPYLGKYNDPATCYGYPDLKNRCHHAAPPQPILLDYQTNVCLSGKHPHCPVFPDGWKTPFPHEISGDLAPARRSWPLWLGIGSAILVLIILLYVFFFRHPGSNPPAGEPPTSAAALIQDPTSTPLSQPAAISTSTLTSTALAPTPTATPSRLPPTAAPTQASSATPVTSPTPAPPTPGPLEGTPFGPAAQYLVYISKEGDTLESLAKLYDTTVEVLKAINLAPPQTGLWVGVPTIIIIGEKDPSKVIPLKAVWLAERTPVLELRQQYNTPTGEFRTLNALGPGTWVEGGRWLIVYR